MNFQEKINHNQNFSEFSETEPINVREVASFFQDTIHFHSGHLQPMTLSFYYYSTCGIILNKSRPLFLGFHWYEYGFLLFKVTLKNGDRACLRRHLWIFCFVPNGVNLFSKSAQNCVFWLWNDFILAKPTQSCVFWSNCFFLGIAGKNSRICQNSLTSRDSVMVIFRFLGQNGLKLELRAFAVHKILMEH